MLKNMKIRFKLLFMLALPIAGMLYFAARDVSLRYEILRDSRTSHTLTSLAVASSSLVHELQKERGMTAGFLASKGEKFRPELAKQREETNGRITKLKEFISANGAKLEPVSSTLTMAGTKLEKLSTIRENADIFKLEGKDSFAFYSQAISAYLDIISTIANVSNQTAVISNAISYYAFLNIKEQAGRERATLNAVFSANRFDDETYRRFLSILAAQSEYFNVFSKFTDEKEMAYTREKLSTSAAKQVEEMRATALAKTGSGEFGIAPETWFKTITDKINTMKEVEDHISKKLLDETIKLESSAKTDLGVSAAITLIVSIAALGIGFLLFISIIRPLKGMLLMLKDIAEGEGDLTRRLDDQRRDEIGEVCRWFNTFVDRIRTIISQVAVTTAHVATSAVQLNGTAEQIATAAEEVAAQSTTVATASEEMSATSSDIARNCTMAADGSNHATSRAEEGAQVVHETLQGMEQIAERVRESAHTVEGLGARSDQIGTIVGTIQDIADQTNLLALNAAIEAARAGEQGRGFAVVADEVRALAERTTRATKEISKMIHAIQSETVGAVASMESGVKVVEMGMVSSRRSGEALKEILRSIAEVTMQVHQIATAAEEQTATTGEISNNIQQITEVVHETARGAHETADAASQLSELASSLQAMVGRFKLS